MSHIHKLRYNGHKNAVNARNKTLEAGRGHKTVVKHNADVDCSTYLGARYFTHFLPFRRRRLPGRRGFRLRIRCLRFVWSFSFRCLPYYMIINVYYSVCTFYIDLYIIFILLIICKLIAL